MMFALNNFNRYICINDNEYYDASQFNHFYLAPRGRTEEDEEEDEEDWGYNLYMERKPDIKPIFLAECEDWHEASVLLADLMKFLAGDVSGSMWHNVYHI